MAIKWRCLRIWLLLVAATGAHGLRADEAPEVKLRFTVFCTEQIAPGEFSYVTGPARRTRLQPLVFYPTSRSPIYEFAGTLPLQIVDSQSRDLVARVDVPHGITEPLVILQPLHPAPAGGPRYQVLLIDDSRQGHKAGGITILNLSDLELAGKVDRKQVLLTRGYNGPFPVGRIAQVQLRTSFKGRTYHSYGGTIDLGREGRALLILLPPYYKGSLEVQSRVLLDEAPVPDKKGGAAKP